MIERPRRNPGLLPNVIQAIADLQELHGSTTRNIEQYVTNWFPRRTPKENVNVGIRKALKDGVDTGLLAYDAGKYKLSSSPSKTLSISKITGSDLAKQHRRRRRRRGRRRRRSRRRRRRRRRYSISPSVDTATDEKTNFTEEQVDEGETVEPDDNIGISKRAEIKPPVTMKKRRAMPKMKQDVASKGTECEPNIRKSPSRKSVKSLGRRSIKDCRSKSRKLEEANEQLNRNQKDDLSSQNSNETIEMNRVNFKRRNDMDYKDSYLN